MDAITTKCTKWIWDILIIRTITLKIIKTIIIYNIQLIINNSYDNKNNRSAYHPALDAITTLCTTCGQVIALMGYESVSCCQAMSLICTC